MNKNKKPAAKITVFITSIFVILSSVTYAFITQTLAGTKEVVVSAGVLDLVLEEENEITISDAMPMYDEVGMIQEDVFKFRLVNKTTNDTNYILKLQEIETGTLDKSIVKYGLIKEDEKRIDFVSNITDGVIDEGVISGNDTIDYELRLWIDSSVPSLTQVQSKFLSFRMSAAASQEMVYVPATNVNELVDVGTTGENCKTYDDGIDTFLVGQCSNNYVWYSGKLWRVVLKNNETGAVKMVTDNPIAAITYNENYNSSFENSYMDQWLNQEFLPTLHDYEDYLVVDSIWDATICQNSPPARPSYGTSVNRTVGLLSYYEYYTTYGKSDDLAINSTGYLNNLTGWYLITPYNTSQILMVRETGGVTVKNMYSGDYAIRPSVNLKSEIKISRGTGIKSNPYILEEDMEEPTNGITLLSTRQSGEYITFNNELYRIVDKDKGLTKIVSVDVPSELLKVKFNESKGVVKFSDASIMTTLETYYQNLATSNASAYNMIEPNTVWYLGIVAPQENYKLSVCETVDINVSTKGCVKTSSTTTTSIAMQNKGEMFASQITRGTKENFWLLTFSNGTGSNATAKLISNNSGGFASLPNKTYGVRPSMYLKQNVVIASDNTGNGTYEHPYKIELGA